MNKKDIVINLSRVLGTTKESYQAVENVFNSIKEALRKKEKVVITNFGSFYVKLTPERIIKLPKTQKTLKVPAGLRVKFIPSKKLLK